MKTVTKHDAMVAGVIKFIKTYATTPANSYANFPVKVKQLRALDLSTATTEEVDAIIGNNSWTYLECSECATPVDVVAVFEGTDCGYSGSTTQICLSCLKEALGGLATSAINHEGTKTGRISCSAMATCNIPKSA